MKKENIILWCVVVFVGLFISYRILEYQWKCHDGASQYQTEMKKHGHVSFYPAFK